MASGDLGEELSCSICLNIYTDPVSLKCGHNYCQECIKSALDTQEGCGVYSCPECREQYEERPAPEKNRKLGNIVESFLGSQTKPGASGVLCTYCDSPVPAAKTCLLCEASFCVKHLSKHSKSPEHVLSEPTDSFQERKCPKHQELLKYYCLKDSEPICTSCWVVGDHQGHHVELLNVAFKRIKEELSQATSSMKAKREEAENRVQRLEDHRKTEVERALHIATVVNDMIKEIWQRLNDLVKSFRSEVTRQKDQTSVSASDLISRLQTRQDELSREIERMEELGKISDPLTFLKKEAESDADDDGGGDVDDDGDADGDVDDDVEDDGDVNSDDDVSSVGRLDEGILVRMLQCGLEHFAKYLNGLPVKGGLKAIQKSYISLDMETAGPKVYVSWDLRTATYRESTPYRYDVPERFQCQQVLSQCCFSTGTHYWEVDVSEAEEWLIGVAASSIERKVVGHEAFIGFNNKSWSLQYKKGLTVWHNNVHSKIEGGPVKMVGIFLDYEMGRLSFYQLCNTIRHLYTFTTTFSEPLHAAFYICKDTTVKIVI